MVHVGFRLAVSSGCDVGLSSVQSSRQDYWTIMSHNKHHTGDSLMSYTFPVFSSEDGKLRWIYTPMSGLDLCSVCSHVNSTICSYRLHKTVFSITQSTAPQVSLRGRYVVLSLDFLHWLQVTCSLLCWRLCYRIIAVFHNLGIFWLVLSIVSIITNKTVLL